MNAAGSKGKPPSEQVIKQAALRLFSEKGFHATSTRDITEAAGVSKGTLYWHWKNKEEIAFSLVADMLSDFLEVIKKISDEKSPAGERLKKLITEVAGLYYEETDYLRLLWKFRADRQYIFSQPYLEKVTSYYVGIRKALENMIKQGIKDGEFRKVDAKRMAFIMLGVAEGLEVEWLENESELSMRDAMEEAMGIIIESLRKR